MQPVIDVFAEKCYQYPTLVIVPKAITFRKEFRNETSALAGRRDR